ncbi:hypothetical protein QNH20_01220 [Neobacillus sp. WH10]|uniref:hypothetical protein n=1 Tax=Neobacillus sp. WH10 TaxID=3047873 RepID=UPI0024C151DB|nr:hypothetical protein [Neobacillus sp. WH10]WHY77829.1 hypothetical protein QNH20_01220 [Neobacillus sp. WH10]
MSSWPLGILVRSQFLLDEDSNPDIYITFLSTTKKALYMRMMKNNKQVITFWWIFVVSVIIQNSQSK